METSENNDGIGDSTQLTESNQNSQATCRNDEVPTLHLKLDISDNFLNYVRLMLAWLSKDSATQIRYSDRSKCEELNDKQVPAELPLLTLSVGSKKLTRTDECDIVARFYYLAKKVVCQRRDGTLSRRVEIPFADITSIHVCFDHGGLDTLRIEAKVEFKSFSSVDARPGRLPVWRVEDPEDADRFPESKFVFLETEKGVLERGFAKLLYTDPRLLRVANFSRGTSTDQSMHHGSVNAQVQQTNMPALPSSSSSNVSPYIGG